MRVFELGWRLDIKDSVLTIYVPVVLLVEFLPFQIESMKAAAVLRVFDDGPRPGDTP